MKALTLITLLLSTTICQAQVRQLPAEKSKTAAEQPVKINSGVKNIPVKTTDAPAKQSPPPPPTPPPPAPPPPAQAPTVVDYKLTDVRVKITTGRDNKENSSEVYVKFSLPEQFNASYCAFAQWNLQNEMPVNSDVEVGLYKRANANLSLISTKLTMSNPEQLRTGGKDISLTDIQAHGGRLMIKYYPHLFTDAWRIENVTITLEFKNQQNELHPVYGRKTISFSNARTFLNAGNERYLICEVGTDLSAMVSYTKN
ncbi:hypothetical protein [Terrimonas ferruginea]|uniref:hypothetical protein n=1 Tax=Terrimonas ferruginea TaxID=249 RepID=UPI0003FACC28|nr:hypothetical protein [Terrimonas ferruginea]